MSSDTTGVEALLRQRLTTAQLKDLDKTGSFCIETNCSWGDYLYRVCVFDGPDWWLPVTRFVVDKSGHLRNFWISGYGSAAFPNRSVAHLKSVLVAKCVLEAAPTKFEGRACHFHVMVAKRWLPQPPTKKKRLLHKQPQQPKEQ